MGHRVAAPSAAVAAIANDPAASTGCIAGATPHRGARAQIADAGFERVRVSVQAQFRELVSALACYR